LIVRQGGGYAMGNVKSDLDPQDVEDYVTLSYLTHRQIYRFAFDTK
jgi:hypothetical protein